MLDTHGRRFVQPTIAKTAGYLDRRGLTPDQVTVLACLCGCGAALLIWAGRPGWGVLLLWISGFLDAVDGTMARLSKGSPWGTVLDVTLDRVVEGAVLVALALRHPRPETLFLFFLLALAIIFSMTIFLTVGAVARVKGEKSFYYQAGLAERTEGFIFLSLMALFQEQLILWTGLFLVVVAFTGVQRLLEARRLLRGAGTF